MYKLGINWESDWPQAGCCGSPGPSQWPVPPHLRSGVARECRWNTQSPHLDKLPQWLPCREHEVDLISSCKIIASTETGLGLNLTAAAGAGAVAVFVSHQSWFYWRCCCHPPTLSVCLWCRGRQPGPGHRRSRRSQVVLRKMLHNLCRKTIIVYSVKRVPLNFTPLGSVEAGDTNFLIS